MLFIQYKCTHDINFCILIKGFDTTATTVHFIILMLAMHPEYQEKVFDEISDIFPDDTNFDVTAEDIAKLTYTDLVIKETLRLFPVVPLMSKQAKTKMEIGSEIIWKNKNVCEFSIEY